MFPAAGFKDTLNKFCIWIRCPLKEVRMQQIKLNN